MATTRETLRQRLSELLGDWNSFTTSSAGNGGGTTLVAVAILDIPEGNDDDGIINWFVTITSGTNDGETRRVSAYTASSGTVTVSRAFTAQVASGVTFELHRRDPNMKHQAINRAGSNLFPSVYLPVNDESIVVDQLLLNGSLDTFSSTFTSWANIGTPTLAAETTRKVHGTGSASIAATGATEGIEQNVYTRVNIQEVVGKTLHIKGWVFATVASAARLRVTFDGTTYTNGAWHGGDAEWEGPATMYINAAIPADATEMTISCEVESGNTAYFDLVMAYIEPVYSYTMPSSIVGGDPVEVQMQDELHKPWGNFTRLGAGNTPTAGRLLRVKGMAVLTLPATDAASMEVDEPMVNIVVEYAAWWLDRALRRQAGMQVRARLAEDMETEEEAANRLLSTYGQTMTQPAVHPHVGWRTGRDGTTTTLVLTQRRYS